MFRLKLSEKLDHEILLKNRIKIFFLGKGIKIIS